MLCQPVGKKYLGTGYMAAGLAINSCLTSPIFLIDPL